MTRIPQIQIQQQYAKIGIKTTPGKLQIQQKKADISIRQPQGELQIEQTPVKVTIDSYPSRYDRGIKNNSDFGRDNFYRARNIAQEATGMIASEGDRLMRIEDGGNPIAQIGLEKTTEHVEVGLKWVRGPEFDVIPPKLNIRYTPRKPEITVQPNKPEVNISKSNVEISMRQYADIQISWKGTTVDHRL